MSTNQLNDISQVYLSQIAEETPGERIDRISKENVAKSKAKADADIAVRNKKTEEYQKHKQSVLAKGGRPVDALDSWNKKQAHKEAYALAEDMSKDKEGHTTGGFRISNKEASAAKKRVKAKSAGQELETMEKDDDAFGAPKAKKVKKESFSDWRNDLREIVAEPEEKAEKEVKEKNVKNKVIINPTFQEAINDIGGEVLDAVELDEVKVTKLDDKKKKEERDKKVKTMLARQAEWESGKKKALHASHEPEGENLDEKDSYKTVAAVIDYDRAKKGSKDATYDSDHGKKKAAKKERDYAAWEREKMKRDDPNWKHKKYHTGMHGESVEADEYIETVSKVKKAENVADKERWAVDEAVKGEDTQDRKDAAAERRSGKVGGVKTPKRLAPSKGRQYVKGTKASIEWWKDHNKKKAKVEEQSNPGDTRPQSPTENKDDPTLAAKEKRISQMKKMVLLKKMQAVRSGAGAEITASYEPEGEVIDETLMSVKAATHGMPYKKRQEVIDKYKKSENNRGTDKKKGRDAGALARERLKKEGFSNWRDENLTENGNKGKPGYVNIGMGVWVKKEDAEKKKAQLAKSVRGENIPGFKRGRID